MAINVHIKREIDVTTTTYILGGRGGNWKLISYCNEHVQIFVMKQSDMNLWQIMTIITLELL